MQPYKGDGQFQWNTGGWFGSQIGSTAYLILLGTLLAIKEMMPGLVILFCGLIPNFVGYRMWSNRNRLAPYPAIQKLLLTIFLFTAMALGTAIYFEHVDNSQHLVGARMSLWILLIFPAIMLLFHYLEKSGKKRIMSQITES